MATHNSTPPLPPQDRMDLNTVTKEDLVRVAGVGEAAAQAILSYREVHGGFLTVDELEQVPGIADSQIQRLRGYVTA